MKGTGLENPAARLFSNPAGDYGSMVNERVGAGNWDSGQELGDTWASRNAFSYGRWAFISIFQCSPCAANRGQCLRREIDIVLAPVMWQYSIIRASCCQNTIHRFGRDM